MTVTAHYLDIIDSARQAGSEYADADNTGHPVSIARSADDIHRLAKELINLSDYQRARALIALIEGAIDAERLHWRK